ncbi:hypothetical protein B0T11DRAFT_331303 [Plectosphaerella cucumerina]|uniref:Uncharacterized protein n=1 Tax=Plectosphaerella cucumerina TaxID=40658 RepID=A0A8K0WZE6_9PEZI|nr:hypothetical protein B0T11DRAFT_331303 [Plectosphaerella cucumerina]
MKFLGVVFATLAASALAHPVTHEKLGKVPEPNYALIDNFDIDTSDPIIPPEPPIKPKTKPKPENELFRIPILPPSIPPWGPLKEPAEPFGPFENKLEPVIHPYVESPFDILLKKNPVKPAVKPDPKKVKESELIREEAMRKLNKDWEEMAERAAARNNKAKSDS